MVAHLVPRQSVALLAAVLLASAFILCGDNPVRAAGCPLVAPASSQDTAPPRHDTRVAARRYEFAPARIEVGQDDLVKITFVAEDIPHSFTIDEYRIAKRATPGHPATFEFRADRPGTLVFYCNLTGEDGCRKMRGELVVAPRPR